MRSQRVFVAGHRGLVGSALTRALRASGYPDPIVRTRAELDLTDQRAVRDFMASEKPDAVMLAAAKVGGIHANNTYRWDFIYDNLAIQNNVISASLESGVDRLVFFGSSCIYPKLAPQPMREDALLTGPLEPTNEPYAIAKIAGVKMIEAAAAQYDRKWVSLMPTNLYGPGDNFDLQNAHVLPAMLRKFHEAKVEQQAGGDPTVHLWGRGTALREFLHVDDLARAGVFMLDSGVTGLYNVGSGAEMSIRELANTMASVVGYTGRVEWDSSKPDGTPRKLLDSSRINQLGWRPAIDFRDGLSSTYEWYLSSTAARL
jgi:GDP-L-fucose synthase